jgi:hypothetical protein
MDDVVHSVVVADPIGTPSVVHLETGMDLLAKANVNAFALGLPTIDHDVFVQARALL